MADGVGGDFCQTHNSRLWVKSRSVGCGSENR